MARRAFYQTNFYQGEPEAYRRLLFARWLYLQGKIHTEVKSKTCLTSLPTSLRHSVQPRSERALKARRKRSNDGRTGDLPTKAGHVVPRQGDEMYQFMAGYLIQMETPVEAFKRS